MKQKFSMTDGAREQRLRRAAQCEGLKLVKSRHRDPGDLGRYYLTDERGWVVVYPFDGLDQVEAAFSEEDGDATAGGQGPSNQK
jgi:hypothetical protein